MPLLDLWKSNPVAVEQLNVEQVVATAGNGRLADSSLCSQELRAFLREVASEALGDYLQYCLSDNFSRSGYVLQDVVNELGRRLDFEVENGLYKGSPQRIGFDGLWTAPEGNQIIVEVKTTDTYRISLDTLITYKKKLRQENRVKEDASVLIVVGRQDTGDLEAQVRGSRYAWEIRLISAYALVKLVTLKERTEEAATLEKMRTLLIPLEYTRVDQLIDVLLTAARDVESAVETEQTDLIKEETSKEKRIELTDGETLHDKRQAMLAAIERVHGLKLVKKSRATYWDADRSLRVVCTISKRYPDQAYTPYWYAYHPTWDDFLAEGETGLFVLGCADLDVAFAIPRDTLAPLLPKLNTTEREDGKMYWHIKIVEETNGERSLLIPNQPQNVSLSQYEIPLATAQTK